MGKWHTKMSESDFDQWLEDLAINWAEIAKALERGEPFYDRYMVEFESQRAAFERQGRRKELAALYREINRFYYSLKEGKYISAIMFLINRDTLRNKWRIKSGGSTRHHSKDSDAYLWMQVAALYMYGLKRKAGRRKQKRKTSALLAAIPNRWLTEAERWPDCKHEHIPEDKRSWWGTALDHTWKTCCFKKGYIKWHKAVAIRWSEFVMSYEREWHFGVRQDGSHVYANLDFFVGHPKAAILRTLRYWPSELSYFAYDKDGLALYRALLWEFYIFRHSRSDETASPFPPFTKPPPPRPPKWLTIG